MKLYNYFRSSASFRVRIALNLKGLAYEYIPVHIAKGEHKLPAYVAVSADLLVPTLEINGRRLSQSMAIIEYLDEMHPAPALIPSEPFERAQVRALSQSIACEIHPINNLRVLRYLSAELKVSEEDKNTWYRHWVRSGLEAFERQLALLPDSVLAAPRHLLTAVWFLRFSMVSDSKLIWRDCPEPWLHLMLACNWMRSHGRNLRLVRTTKLDVRATRVKLDRA